MMDLRKLQIFVAVVTEGNFSRAAERLYMAQPPVSIAVKKLEQQLGATLLIRDRKQLSLTPEGREVFEQAKCILQQVDDLSQSVGEYSQLLRGELKLACPSMVGTYFLPDVLGAFLDLHPGLTASVTQAGTQKIEQMILNDDIELGVVTQTDLDLDLEVVPLLSETICVCVAAKHPLRQKAVLKVSDLDQLPMVLYQSDYFIRRRLDVLCGVEGIEPDIRLQTNYLPLIAKMVKQNRGATVALSMMAEQEAGLHALPLDPQESIEIGIAYRRGRQLSKANRGFVDWLSQR
ncbi:MAG: LysR family transcriptional regulator [Cellvibrionaceae bacterium]